MEDLIETFPKRYRKVFLILDPLNGDYIHAKTFDTLDEAIAYKVEGGHLIDIRHIQGKRVRNQIGATLDKFQYGFFDIHTYDIKNEAVREYHIRRDFPAFYCHVQSEDLEYPLLCIDSYLSNVRVKL